jgi:2,3,4,5-tetrahydropyridine-2-carboxylate N-succinyltransferase
MSIENIISEAWEKRDQITPSSDENLKNTVNQIIDDLDSGKVRVAEKIDGEWKTHQYLKKSNHVKF